MTGEGVTLVVPPELEWGFRLAGVETTVANDSAEADSTLERLLGAGHAGVIGVYEPFLAAMEPDRRADYEASLAPIVVPLPAGREPRDEDAHRARISDMLSRAVGYHITFGGEVKK